jgi:hypothetical protein
MQAAGHLVGILIEFTAGVEDGHDDLGGRASFGTYDAGRDAAAIILDTDRLVGMQGDTNLGTIAGENFVNGIIDGLENHVMKTRSVLGITNIHTRALTDGIQTFEDLYAVLIINGMGCHERTPLNPIILP